MLKAKDLRSILAYVPNFRDKVFVLNIDSEVLADQRLPNLFMDMALLRSLNIRLVIVFGISEQLLSLSKKTQAPLSDVDGIGITDSATLELSIHASGMNAMAILQGLSDQDLSGAVLNAVVGHPRGILSGVDQQYTGKVEKVLTKEIQLLLERGVVPIIAPLGFDGAGHIYRINSDAVACEIAKALHANKLIFLTPYEGIRIRERLVPQLSIVEAQDYLKTYGSELTEDMCSKLEYSIKACSDGVERCHILDGGEDEALLGEIFFNEGVGTMVYANQYSGIRSATVRDVRAILSIIRASVEAEELVKRTADELTQNIEDYYVMDIDGTIVGCVALPVLQQEPKVLEMACLFVHPSHENQGIGKKLMIFAQKRAQELGARRLVALSTQAYNYLEQKGGFKQGDHSLLPEPRLQAYQSSGRNSKIFFKDYPS